MTMELQQTFLTQDFSLHGREHAIPQAIADISKQNVSRNNSMTATIFTLLWFNK